MHVSNQKWMLNVRLEKSVCIICRAVHGICTDVEHHVGLLEIAGSLVPHKYAKLLLLLLLLRDYYYYYYYYYYYTVSQKNVLTLKRYSSKLQGVILMKFGRSIQNTLE